MRVADDLSLRAARLLLECVRAYWVFSERTEIDRDHAVRRARDIFNLCGEVAQGDSDRDPEYPRLVLTCGLLAIFGDGYALHSVEWPEGQPTGALPDRAAMEINLRSLKAREWARAIVDPGQGNLEVESENAYSPRTTTADDGDQLAYLRAGEAPDWAGYGEARSAAASALLVWINEYRRAVRLLDAGDEEFLTAVTELRADVLQALAWARTAVGYWQVHGAETEAILAAGLLSEIMRSIFLIGTGEDLADLRDLHILRIDSLDDVLSTHALDGWAEAVLRNAT